jgi:alpha-tubulin suppressor-like RCC1 family protein/chitodextrinase
MHLNRLIRRYPCIFLMLNVFISTALLFSSMSFNMPIVQAVEEDFTANMAVGPSWPEGSKIEATNIGAINLTLTWTPAEDATGVTDYKIYQDGLGIGSVEGNTFYYDVDGLLSSTEYTFKVEAGNAGDIWSKDGPSLQVVTGGGGQLQIAEFSPSASEKENSETQVYYVVNELIAPDKVHFLWNFSNGFDRKLIANLEKISLVKKSDNSFIALDVGGFTQEQLDQDTSDIITLGDFKYTKQQSPKLRQIELILGQSLEPFTTYVIKMASDIESNNGGKLGKNYCYEFTTSDPGDTISPTWPEGSQLIASHVTPNAVVLEWTAAQDNVVIVAYKILQDDVVVATVDGRTNICEIIDLVPNTGYSFKVEAIDGCGNESTSGPGILVTTGEADNIPPYWPEGSELTATHAAAPALVLHWTPAMDNLGVVGYHIFQDGQLLATVDNSVLKYHVTGLETGRPYSFMVKAVDYFNNCSEGDPSLEVILDREDNSLPFWPKASGWQISHTPALVTITVTMGWDEASDDTGIFGYRIYQNNVLIAEVDENTRTYSLELPVDNQSYTYRIAAGDAAGNWSLHPAELALYSGDPDQDLTAPVWPQETVISVSEITDNTLKITWTPAEDDRWIEKYSILMDGNYVYSANIGEVSERGSVNFEERTCLFNIKDCVTGYNYTPEQLAPGTVHEFSIIAYDRNLNAKRSPVVKVALGGSLTMGAVLGPLGKKGFDIVAPECKNESVDNVNGVNNRVINLVDPANVYFCWDFTADLKPAADAMYMNNVILKNKLTGEQVNLAPEDFVVTQNDDPIKVRKVELKLESTLQDHTTYILTLKKDFCGQSIYDGRLGTDFNWEFITAVADSEKPTWPMDSRLSITEAPTSITLSWPSAMDNVAVTGYEIIKTENGNDEILAVVDGDTTLYTISDLGVDTSYSFKVCARDYVGNLSDYLEVTGTTAEADTVSPTWENKTLNCMDVAASSLVLNWVPAQDDWGVVAYKVYKNGIEIAKVNAEETKYTVEHLLPETEYTFKVEAGDAFNNWSGNGPKVKVNTLADTTAPSWPEGSIITRTAVSNDSVTLEWTAAMDDVAVTSYKIFQNDSSVQEVIGKTTCTISGLEEITEYIFKVEAVDAAGNCSDNGPCLTQWTTPQNTVAPAGCRLAMGYFHTLMLSDDGTLWAWGDNIHGQLGDGTTVNRAQPVEIKGINGIKSVAAGHKHSLALKEDGTVWAWGNKTLVPTQVSGLAGIVGIGSGDFEGFAFDANGVIWVLDSDKPVQIGQLKGITAIVGGRYHSLALRNDQTVWAWGTNEWGAMGTGNQRDQYSNPVEIPGLSGIVQIDAMADNSVVVKADGTVWTFGQNQYGQLGDGTTETSFSPVQVANLTGIKAAAAAKYHMAVLKNDGSIWSWGYNGNGRLGNGTEEDSSTPVQAINISDISRFAAGEWDTVAIKGDGTIMAWGGRGWSSFNPTNIGLFRAPVLEVALGNMLVNQAVRISFEDHADWRANISQIMADGMALNEEQYKVGAGAVTIDAEIFDKAKNYVIVIKALGYDDARIILRVMSEISLEAFSFDENTRNLALTDQIVSAIINCPVEVTDASISFINYLPIPAFGQKTVTSNALPSMTVEVMTPISTKPIKLEIPQGTTISAPVEWDGLLNVPTLKNNDDVRVPDEDAGDPARVTCVLEVGSGNNNRGQLGYAEPECTDTPQLVPGLNNVVSITCGDLWSVAIKKDGTVWAWGCGSMGQLGNGSRTAINPVPVQVEGLTDIVSVATGGERNLAIKKDGTIWGWGRGLGKEAANLPATTPIQLEGLTGVIDADAGWRGQLTVKDDGTVWNWVPDYENKVFIPQQLDVSDVKAINIKRPNAYAIKNDGTVWIWENESYVLLLPRLRGYTE